MGLLTVQRPRRATRAEMTRFHTDEYIDLIARVTPEIADELTDNGTRFLIGEDCPALDGLFDFCSISCGGSISAANRINSGLTDVAINWSVQVAQLMVERLHLGLHRLVPGRLARTARPTRSPRLGAARRLLGERINQPRKVLLLNIHHLVLTWSRLGAGQGRRRLVLVWRDVRVVRVLLERVVLGKVIHPLVVTRNSTRLGDGL